MKRVLILFVLFLTFSSFSSEEDGIWKTLLNVGWEYKYSEEFEMDIPFPIFTDEIKAIENKEVKITGFVLPVETEDNSIMLSVYPFSSCFFCGGAGPESVIAVFLKNQREIGEEEITLKGVLKLNDDETGLIYELRDAVEVNSNY
ncbi:MULTISPECIES: DUF3299 domain-containing protein [Flammeovirga]|uniref:DUF3299 domain-containing protein n=1 Tax=Flammeovirga agarivorans TaxID=2726742 RepID=A0A7X8SLW9_9BACT|nr:MULTISPECIES: DUF3299 domain-containing protein [Flammeovirga]NLR92542.1 DUF3299 domain-containing protein [Flammeovirga agarivorans]